MWYFRYFKCGISRSILQVVFNICGNSGILDVVFQVVFYKWYLIYVVVQVFKMWCLMYFRYLTYDTLAVVL